MASVPSPSYSPPLEKCRASSASASPLRIRVSSPKTSSTPSTPCPRSATTSICPFNQARLTSCAPCSASTRATGTSSASPGPKPPSETSRSPPTSLSAFPGETDHDFEQTMTLLETVGYDAIFGFKYSPRPNTPAIHMHDSIPEESQDSTPGNPQRPPARNPARKLRAPSRPDAGSDGRARCQLARPNHRPLHTKQNREFRLRHHACDRKLPRRTHHASLPKLTGR